MAIRAVAEGEGNMGLNIQADVDLDGRWAGRTTIPVPDVRVPGGAH